MELVGCECRACRETVVTAPSFRWTAPAYFGIARASRTSYYHFEASKFLGSDVRKYTADFPSDWAKQKPVWPDSAWKVPFRHRDDCTDLYKRCHLKRLVLKWQNRIFAVFFHNSHIAYFTPSPWHWNVIPVPKSPPAADFANADNGSKCSSYVFSAELYNSLH